MEIIDALRPEEPQYDYVDGIVFHNKVTELVFLKGKNILDFSIEWGMSTITIPYFAGYCEFLSAVSQAGEVYDIELLRTNGNHSVNNLKAEAEYCSAIFNLTHITLKFYVDKITFNENK